MSHSDLATIVAERKRRQTSRQSIQSGVAPPVRDYSQSQIAFQIVGGDPHEFQVRRYRGTEGLSQVYRFLIDIATVDRAVLPGEYSGRAALLTIEGSHGPRCFHGIISRFEEVGEGPNEIYYQVELVPSLWLLTHRYASRIFQHKSVPEIVSSILTKAGIASDRFSFCLTNRHPAREYCVQYRETDFNFVSRLMEEEGIFYFFEHARDGHKLIMADSQVVYRPIVGDANLRYVPPTGMNHDEDHIYRFRFGHEVRPGAVTLRDYNFENPRLDLQCKSDNGRDVQLEISDYPGEYQLQASGFDLARLRTEELECRRKLGTASSNCLRLQPGHSFALTHHPRYVYNAPYLVTRVTHSGRQAVAHSFANGGGADGVLDPRLTAALRKAQSHPDEAVKGMAEAVLQFVASVQKGNPLSGRALPRWLCHAGQLTSDPAAVAAAIGGDPTDFVSLIRSLAGEQGGTGVEREGPLYECQIEFIPAEVTYRPPRVTPWPEMRGCQTAVVVGPQNEEIYTDKHGRVKVQFHWDRDGKHDENASCWMRVSQPWAGVRFGGMAIPRVGQEVIVDFLEGDPDQPIITGRVYNGETMPPQDLPAHKVRTSIRSNTYPGGGGFNEITMDDTKGQEHFYEKAQYDKTNEIGHNRNTSVGLDSTEIVGNNVAEVVGNNKSTDVTNAYNETCDTYLLNAKTSITLQCGASRIHMNQAGFITITGTVITSAASINNSVVAPLTQIVGAGLLVETGGVIEILGGVAQMRAAGQASVHGAKVDVVADGDNVIQGGKVKIN